MFAALNPEEFKHCFVEWVKTLQKTLNSVIAIDGKTLCNRMDKLAGTLAIHMVSPFETAARLVLAQQKVDKKSNEITAIPKLLDLLDLKGHQGTLNEDVRLLLETELKKSSSTIIDDYYEETDKEHGRIETRTCYVSSKRLAYSKRTMGGIKNSRHD